MANIDIDLEPDPQRDADARRAALALITATYYDADDAQEGEAQELSGAALQDLLGRVVGTIDVRPESAPALSEMLSTAARQFTAFSAVAYAVAEQAFLAGQRSPDAPGPDYAEVLRGTSELLQQLADEQ